MSNSKKTQFVINHLNSMYIACSHPYTDGFTGSEYKKDLLRVKYYLDNLIRKCPTYVNEQEFIDELEKQQTWETLKHDIR